MPVTDFTKQLIAQVTASVGRIDSGCSFVARVKGVAEYPMQFICKETPTLAESDSANGTTSCFWSADDAQDMTMNALRDRRRRAFQTNRAFQSADLRKKGLCN